MYMYKVDSMEYDDLKIQIEPGDEQTHSCKTANGNRAKTARKRREKRG